jgi:hypothetical protein
MAKCDHVAVAYGDERSNSMGASGKEGDAPSESPLAPLGEVCLCGVLQDGWTVK